MTSGPFDVLTGVMLGIFQLRPRSHGLWMGKQSLKKQTLKEVHSVAKTGRTSSCKDLEKWRGVEEWYAAPSKCRL